MLFALLFNNISFIHVLCKSLPIRLFSLFDCVQYAANEIILPATSDEYRCDGRRRRKRWVSVGVVGDPTRRVWRRVGCRSFYRCNNDTTPVYVICTGNHVVNTVTNQCDRWVQWLQVTIPSNTIGHWLHIEQWALQNQSCIPINMCTKGNSLKLIYKISSWNLW